MFGDSVSSLELSLEDTEKPKTELFPARGTPFTPQSHTKGHIFGSCLRLFYGQRCNQRHHIWNGRNGLSVGHQRRDRAPARNTSECKLGEGKHLWELRTGKKTCEIRGKPFHLRDLSSILSLALGETVAHQFICIRTKQNLKHFHYHKSD